MGSALLHLPFDQVLVDLSHFFVVRPVLANLLRRDKHLVLLVQNSLYVLLLALHVLIDHHFRPVVVLDDSGILTKLVLPHIILQLALKLGCAPVV